MKKCIKSLTSWLLKWVGKMDKVEKISFSIGVVLGLIVSVIAFRYIDTKPATN